MERSVEVSKLLNCVSDVTIGSSSAVKPESTISEGQKLEGKYQGQVFFESIDVSCSLYPSLIYNLILRTLSETECNLEPEAGVGQRI